jgi:phosphoglycolate phosphatase-like HAD superfamily hydrolase
MSRLLLFDIDNTLLWTGGAGGQAMNLAFSEIFGVQDGFARVEFSGRTDLFILASALANHGLGGGVSEHLEPFLSRYYRLLPRTLEEREGYLMPGFPQLLEALAGRPDIRLGLATGNFSEGARIKLEYYGIRQYFAHGGFGEESIERAEVVRRAIQRVAGGAGPAQVLVIGDTPHDITAALDNGATAVGVATGTYTLDELRASGAEIVFADFSDWQTAAGVLAGDLPPEAARR